MRTKITRARILVPAMLILVILSVLAWCPGITRVCHGRDYTTVRIMFPLPMNRADVEKKMRLQPENPRFRPGFRHRWAGPFLLEIEIQEPGRLRGQELTLRVDRAATRIPLLKKSAVATARRPVHPELQAVAGVVPSAGPMEICFNTPLNPETVPGNVRFILAGKPEAGTLTPQHITVDGREVTDYATWLFKPDKPLPHETAVELVVHSALKSEGGLPLGTEIRRSLRTAPELKVAGTRPRPGATDVDLHPEIQVEFNQSLSRGEMKVGDVPGQVDVWANHIQFTPLEPLMPDREYSVRTRAVSSLGEQAQLDFSFRTLQMGDRMWVAVDLEGEHNVTVYRGTEVVRVFKASGGKVTSPTPLGTYFLYNRGYAFWNQHLQEGAYYWMQFAGPYLIHSVPFDASGKLKQEEIEKLGQPASHGCVRLSLADAKWFFHHVPNGTMIVIYNQHRG